MFQKNKINILIAFNLFLFVLSIYMLTSSGENFYHSDVSVMRFEVTKAIVERFDVSIPEGIEGVNGRQYSVGGIGSMLLAIPFYIAAKLMNVSPAMTVSMMTQLYGAATVVLIYLFLISLGYTKRTSLLTSVFYGFGTIAWPLAKQPFSHPITVFFVILSVYLMYLHCKNRKTSYLLLSACSFGIAFIIRPTSLFILPPLFILMISFYTNRSDLKVTPLSMVGNIILSFLVILPFIGIFLWFNYYRFGSIFEIGSTLMVNRTGQDFFACKSVIRGIRGFLISPGKGFFFYSPLAILFFFSIKAFLKKYPYLGISFIFIIIIYPLFYSTYIYWHGDWAWGPRYLLVITPFLIIPIAELIESHIWLKKKGVRLVLLSIFTASLIIQIAAVSVDFQKYFFELIYVEKVEFTEAHGKGILPMVHPPDEIYFDWRKSPILAQYTFIYKMIKEIKDYKYSELSNDTRRAEEFKRSPYMNIFDFWWLYDYYLYGSTWGFTVALLLFLIAIYTALRLWKLTSMSPQHIRLCMEKSMRR